jgi:pimeloyl-ACP methyl ester carboxylesterase
VLLHGWMDVGASFQFLVDALQAADGFDRLVYAPDWRGYGLTRGSSVTDSYWFPDYLADLDALLDALHPNGVIDLVGHSMGGNVVMQYAGVRTSRIRRLVNLEGFGMPATRPAQAPRRLAQWLDELKQPQSLRDYASADEVAQRLIRNNPRLTQDKAAWLAPHWSEQRADGRWHLRSDPAHKRVNPLLYRVEEHLAAWAQIAAPLLWVEGELTDVTPWWGERYSKAEFHQRLNTVSSPVSRLILPASGHMLHHDQPAALARALGGFLGGDRC